jgi:hypothetical protein
MKCGAGPNPAESNAAPVMQAQHPLAAHVCVNLIRNTKHMSVRQQEFPPTRPTRWFLAVPENWLPQRTHETPHSQRIAAVTMAYERTNVVAEAKATPDGK